MSSDAQVGVTFASFVPSATRAMSTLFSESASTVTSVSGALLATPKPMRASGPFPAPSCASTPRPGSTCRSLPVQHDLTTPRARARAARLRANEAAERREDMAALITTPAQWALLRRSFAGVKTEFVDLDGMSWDVPVPVVSAQAQAQAVRSGRREMQGRPAPRSPSACGSAKRPVLLLDDSTVRPNQGRKRRRCVGAWVGAGGYVNGSPAGES